MFAGGSAISSLLYANLLDELHLVLNPVTLGGGTPLFTGSRPRVNWTLVDARRFTSGAMVLRYQRRELDATLPIAGSTTSAH